MRVFFHHVGQAMAARDFPRTVFSRVSIDTVEKNTEGVPRRDLLLSQLRRAFPSGQFNVWGVPEGARSVISRMDVGDYVLLLGLAGIRGGFPAMGQVKVFFPEVMLQLSHVLWGEERFPLIFFFDTERIDYPWVAFADDLGYKGNWRPGGLFYSIKPEKLDRFGGPSRYINHVRQVYGVSWAAEHGV